MSPAERLTAHPRWRWMEGMLDAQSRLRCVTLDADGPAFIDGRVIASADDPDPCSLTPGMVPDLYDPATQGCLLSMLPASGPASDWLLWVDDSGWGIGIPAVPQVCGQCGGCGDSRYGAGRCGACGGSGDALFTISAPTAGEAIALALLAIWDQ